ncbi:MAG: hypothetical protein AAFQ57_07800 [Cyanobacteria bacterium J06626_14]
MSRQDNERSNQPNQTNGKKGLTVVLIASATVLVLTWAVATLFEIAFLKALALVILVLFVAMITLFMVGIA